MKRTATEAAKAFAEAWNSSSSLPEAARKAGVSPNTAQMRAQRFRAKGVNLKSFRRVLNVDWTAVAEAADAVTLSRKS